MQKEFDMAGTVHILHPQSAPLAGFLRVGYTGHRKLEAMLASGHFPYKRVVFEASHIGEQSELVKSLKANGCEIILDPNFAEMASLGRYESAVSKLPWANTERPWEPSDFGRVRNLDIAKLIAEFAVEQGVNVVLSPSHLLEQAENSWQRIDIELCSALRRELDQAGGAGVAIDHQILTTNALLKDPQGRKILVTGIDDLLIDNVWLRTSGFGATATGAGTRAFIESVRELHQIGRPLVADNVGGLAGLAAGAFGAVGGISHGVGQKETFNVSNWKKPSSSGGGMATRVYLPELDRFFKESQLDAIFDARGGRPRFGCNDKSCCPHGIEDMIENAHVHFITQRRRQIDDLSSVPESRRAAHFLLRQVSPAVRSARHGVRLKISDEKVAKAVSDAKARLIRLSDALVDLHESEGVVSRSQTPTFRGSRRPVNAVLKSK